jgi:starch phosphorylase
MTKSLQNRSTKDLTTTACLAEIDCEIHRHLNFTLGHHDNDVDPVYLYRAVALAVRDRLVTHWKETHDKIAK